MTFREFMAILLPYRAHLEDEVDYLRGQVAQKQRRIDEMQATINTFTLGLVKKTAERREPVSIPNNKPRGWDDYRRTRKHDSEASEDGSQEGSKAVEASTSEGVPV
jgi:hypothetical protein